MEQGPKHDRQDRAPARADKPPGGLFSHLESDIPAGLVVFLVALPLCLGIAVASGAPPLAGVLAGIIGGLVVPWISNAQLSVCGPAAGLTAIVLSGIDELGFEAFIAAVLAGGLVQLGLGLARMGTVSQIFPSAVIKGMLAAIGLILILKQLPHAIGYDAELYGQLSFQGTETENTFELVWHALSHVAPGALLICVLSFSLVLLWDKTRLKRLSWFPGALAAVLAGGLINGALARLRPDWALSGNHLVGLPPLGSVSEVLAGLTHPAWSALASGRTWVVGVTIAIVASLETLLCIEAVDRMDPWSRRSPPNRELIAQGVANAIAGLIGALPITSVIIRSSTNINAGAHTRMAALSHGVLLLLSVLFLAPLLRQIPLSCLAAVLLLVGYKLAHPRIFAAMYRAGWSQFFPFVITVGAILFTDLLQGIIVGISVGLVFVLRTNMRASYDVEQIDRTTVIRLRKDVSFLNKLRLAQLMDKIPPGSQVVIDGAAAEFIDRDIKEQILNYQRAGDMTGIDVEVRNIDLEPVREATGT